MTKTNGYIGVRFKLTKSQEDKIKTAYLVGKGVTLKLNKNKISPNSNTVLFLTKAQYQKLQDGNEHNITISNSRLRGSHTGGFLPFLIPILAGLASAAADLPADAFKPIDSELVSPTLSLGSRKNPARRMNSSSEWRCRAQTIKPVPTANLKLRPRNCIRSINDTSFSKAISVYHGRRPGPCRAHRLPIRHNGSGPEAGFADNRRHPRD